MAPKLYNKITRLIEENKLTSLTVDVFDTVLLYNYWPADLRYYDIAVRWLPTVNRLISPKITTYELYDWRMSAKRTLDQEKLSSRIDIWLDVMIDALCNKYNADLSEEEKFEILTNLMAIELEFEIKNTKPNASLIDKLAKIKQEHPQIKIYFVTDSHFMSAQISTMLDIHQIKLFDGGVSSADYNKSKASGELFEQLTLEFGPSFNLATNLHIGDGRNPDFLAPSQRDSLAIHYRPIRLRGLRTLIGSGWLKCLQTIARHQSYRQLDDATRNSRLIWQKYGLLLTEIFQTWTYQAQDLARIHDGDIVIFAGEELRNLLRFAPKLQRNELITIAPELDKAHLLRAFIWLLAAYQTERWDSTRLLQLLMQTEQLTREGLYELCFTDQYNYSPIAIYSFSDQDFLATFLRELLNSDPQYSAPARESYQKIAGHLPLNDKKLAIIQVPSDNTAQLFQNFASLHGVKNHIETFILDQYDVQVMQQQLTGTMNGHREKQIALELSNTEQIHTILAPDVYLTKVLLPSFCKLTQQILRTTA